MGFGGSLFQTWSIYTDRAARGIAQALKWCLCFPLPGFRLLGDSDSPLLEADSRKEVCCRPREGKAPCQRVTAYFLMFWKGQKCFQPRDAGSSVFLLCHAQGPRLSLSQGSSGQTLPHGLLEPWLLSVPLLHPLPPILFSFIVTALTAV